MHKMTVTRGAASILAQVLAFPGLCTDPADLYRAGQVAENHLADLPAGPTPKPGDAASEEAVKAWAADVISIEVTERQRETCKKIVSSAIGKGVIPVGRHSMSLMDALGLSPVE